MALVSVLIPARNERYLNQTVDDIYAKASGEIEVLVMLDGWRPESPLPSRDTLKVIYREEPKGMRNSLNQLARAASGKYLLKLDAHCIVGEGFDEILQQHMGDGWLSVPSRFRLDTDKWCRSGEPIEYLYLTYPYSADSLYGSGFHGKKWIGIDGIGLDMGKAQYYYRERTRKEILIDDIQTIQGSCWFMTRDHFMAIDGLDEVHSFFFQEGQELCFKTWLSGGRCVVNKNTWYAHWHKNEAPQYGMSTGQKRETERFSTWVWMNDKWPKATRPFKWFYDHFGGLPGWPEDWQEHIKPETNFRIFDPQGHDGFKI